MGLGAVLLTAAIYATAAAAVAPHGDRGARVAAHASAKRCQRYWSQADAAAREIARSAYISAEVISTEHNGFYTDVSPATVHATMRTIPITYRQAVLSQESAYLQSASGTVNSFTLTARAFDGDTYSVQQSANGTLLHLAQECGSEHHW
jgi:hypothetical protein